MGCDVRAVADATLGTEHYEALANAAGAWCILLDGASGSGKTTLAGSWARHPAEWMTRGGRPIHVVHLDDLYPGWSGLAAASRIVAREVLRTGGAQKPGYRRWDWHRARPAEWVEVPSEANLIVEGSGVLTSETVQAAADKCGEAVLTVALNMPREQRKRRALERDPSFAEYWDMWEAQEQQHRAHMPRPDVVVQCSG